MRFPRRPEIAPIATSRFPVLPAAHLDASCRAAGGALALGWEAEPARRGGWRAPRGEHSDIRECRPRHTVEGDWQEKTFFPATECGAQYAGPTASIAPKVFSKPSTSYAAGLLGCSAIRLLGRLGLLDRSLDELEQWLGGARQRGSCLLSLGWGAGLPAKSSWLDASNPDTARILEHSASTTARWLLTALPQDAPHRVPE